MKTQQDIINENIIEQMQIRIQQDADKITTLDSDMEVLKKDRDAWIAEYRAARAEVERLKVERDSYKFRRADQELNDGLNASHREDDAPRNSGWSV